MLAGIKAQQGKDVSGQEQDGILQDGKKILPDMLHADHFQASSQFKTAQQGFSSYLSNKFNWRLLC